MLLEDRGTLEAGWWLIPVSMRLPSVSRWRPVRAMVQFALFVALALPVRAEPGDGSVVGPARELWLEGTQFWEAKDYARAADRFDRAYEIEHTPSLGLWVARSLDRAGWLLAAAARYAELSQQNLPPEASVKDWAAKREAQEERQHLLLRIPSVVVAVEGAPKEEVLVTINDQALSSSSIGLARYVDPGLVRVRGTKGEVVVEASVELAEGEAKTVRLAFGARRLPPPAPPRAVPRRARTDEPSHSPRQVALSNHVGDGRRLAGYIGMGVGGAALLTGSVFGLLSLDDESRLRSDCPNSRCPANLASDVDAYESRKTIAAVGLLSGAALTATGVVLYLTAPRGERGARASLYWVGQSAGLRGAF